MTDKGVRSRRFFRQINDFLGTTAAGVYDESPGNPNEAAVRQGWDQFKESEADGIVAIGGGSALDLAKATAILAAHGGELKHDALINGWCASRRVAERLSEARLH